MMIHYHPDPHHQQQQQQHYPQQQQLPYRRKKPLPEIPQQAPSLFPVDPYYYGSYASDSLHSLGLPSGGGPPGPPLPLPLPSSLYRQPSRRRSYTDVHQLLPAGEHHNHPSRRQSMELARPFESLKIEQEEEEQLMSERPPPAAAAPVLLEKPFDPSLVAPLHHQQELHSPNTPDERPVSSKIPSPWGSMVSLRCASETPSPTSHQTITTTTSTSISSSSSDHSSPTSASTHHDVESGVPGLAPPVIPAQPTPPPPPPTSSTASTDPLSSLLSGKDNDADSKQQQQTTLDPYKKPKFTSIASYSLTHNKEMLKTLRRMAAKTRSTKVQMAYAKYLLDIARLYPTLPSRQRIWDEARYWIQKLCKTIPEARYIKGQWHLEEKQTSKALRCFERAAKDGYMAAYVDLAEHAKKQGDLHKALAYYRSADGHAEANYKMAMLLIRNKQVNDGISLLEKAAAEPHTSGKSALVLSMIYSHHHDIKTGVKRNDVLAFRYLKQSVQAGLVDAVHRMGEVYTYGELGQSKDPWQGYQCFVKAADENHPRAMLELAKVYARGIHGFLNAQPQSAFRWCQRAAERGLTEAEYILGIYYEEGVGVDVDYARALECFGKAASKGYTPAAEKLNLPVSHSSIRSSKYHPTNSSCHLM